MNLKRWLVLLLVLGTTTAHGQRMRTDLGGEWNTSLGKCVLPGTTDESKLGEGQKDTTTTFQLTRLYPFSGKLNYTKQVEIPKDYQGKRLFLVMERTKPSTLWIDGDSIGSQSHIYAPHIYALPALTPGMHEVKIEVDNSPSSVPQEIQSSHAWTDGTQTNWNGVLGEFHIEARDVCFIRSMQVYPSAESGKVRVVMHVDAASALAAKLDLSGEAWNSTDVSLLSAKQVDINLLPGDNVIETEVEFQGQPLLWSEFHPNLYKLNARLTGKDVKDLYSVDFGVRNFATDNTHFTINGNKTFLRGKHDACVFPLTGYAPMDVESWRKVFQVAKAYGINYYRCHSYTPPRAAFEAANIEGIYLQPELPLWGEIDRKKTQLNDFLLNEADMLFDYMGNSPSFTMFALGNELHGDLTLMHEWLDDFRAKDNRRLYSNGSNNNLGWLGPQAGEDFFTTCRVGGGEGYTTHVRTSFAFVDAEKGGILNNTYPSTNQNFSYAVGLSPKPVVSHETGQFQIYPNYAEIDKYTGVLYPYNFVAFRNRLSNKGMLHQADDFHKASGLFAMECYKADIEYYLRTPGLGGFQMLDLQDFPGQGTALVGILDAFMDSKGLIEPETFKGFCAPVVPLALMKSYCWQNTEEFVAEIEIANYGESVWNEPLTWLLQSEDEDSQSIGFVNATVAQGEVGKVCTINYSLDHIKKPQVLTLQLATGDYLNSYQIWVYPNETETIGDVYVSKTLNDAVKKRLAKGETVLLNPCADSLKNQTVGPLFTPDYWNYAMFKSISENAKREVSPGTLSILTSPSHPLFDGFPTEMHTNWQWWPVIHHSYPMILDATSADYTPLVQVVDNIERNHKLGLVFECKVGEGKLLVCMTDLDKLADYVEGRAFTNSWHRYLRSADFNPQHSFSWQELEHLFTANKIAEDIQGVENQSDYTINEK